MALPTFPAQFSIPPACFYNAQGLAGWLNQHPSYKEAFATTGAFPYLIPTSQYRSTMSTFGVSTTYSSEKVPLCSNVQTLSQYQALKYGQQIQLFQKIYAVNSNAYVNYVTTGSNPIYYNFLTYNEKNEYNSAVQLINKLYPFKAMADATNLNWQVPFPINM
jgi:hypothetical protein